MRGCLKVSIVVKRHHNHAIFLFCFLFFETGFLCVTVLAVLELVLIDQAGLELTEISLLLLPDCWD